jgi:NADH-quinone oxidoreductase subunit L
MYNVYLTIVLAPLIGALLAGLTGRVIGRKAAHRVTVVGVGLSTVLSVVVFTKMVLNGAPAHEVIVYTWGVVGSLRFEIGFLIDQLSATMMVVVTSVSLMVHIYTIGYMSEDPGYQRFFSYISAFTFAMLMLCMSNNFLQLFFGWEGVGLMSYLLIGFWYDRDAAIYANLKAFLVNRVGDFGFILGIGGVLMYFGSLHFATVFGVAPELADAKISILPGTEWSAMTLICILLFVGAMGKSAQIPLHVWLPDSMEGPTPISALIHAATMVTAGVFMVARMSPLFEYSETALTVVLIVGSATAFLMGLVGLVQNDIKRVVAYSTLSQLGYMMVACGVSAYAAGIFHLATHAFFKALLFLAAGSVIIAMHHDQDIRNMGGLRKYMPITWITALIGTLALVGFPGFAGFFSKDAIIEAVHYSDLPGSGIAYFCVLSGVFITALYSFRMYFLVFHGKERMDEHTRQHLHETPWVVWLPLVLLAIPSVIVGWLFVESALFGGHFGDSIFVLEAHNVLGGEMLAAFTSPTGMVVHGLTQAPTWLALAGVIVAWFLYLKRPELPGKIASSLKLAYNVLEAKYGFDRFNEIFFAGGARRLGTFFWRVGDTLLIDGLLVNGSAKLVGWVSSKVRRVQSGFLYEYAFWMIIGLVLFLTWIVHGWGANT